MIQSEGASSGDLRLPTRPATDLQQKPVTEEQSTHVY